jgi:hypothetical protein
MLNGTHKLTDPDLWAKHRELPGLVLVCQTDLPGGLWMDCDQHCLKDPVAFSVKSGLAALWLSLSVSLWSPRGLFSMDIHVKLILVGSELPHRLTNRQASLKNCQPGLGLG